MRDFVITLVGLALLSSIALTQGGSIIEHFGLNPPLSVTTQPEVVLSGPAAGSKSAARAMGMSAQDQTYQGQMITAPVSLQAAISPRFDGTNDYGAVIQYNMPAMQNLAVPANPLTYGPSQMLNAPVMGDNPKGGCAKGGSMEGYEDTESFEPISGGAAAAMGSAAQRFERAQALADQGIIKADTPPITVQTADGPVSVTVYDRLMYSTSRSRLYGQGDPIRGDIGCIVPIKDQWFRPSVRPNVDLRPGALTIMGGIENDTNRELRALQSLSSAGVSRETSDAYANTVNPALAQKSMGTVNAGKSDVVVSAFF
jgi:hypothetical protein